MSNVLVVYGFPILAAATFALITCGPTVLSFRRKRRSGERVLLRHLCAALSLEIVALVALAVTVDALGLRNPGGYVLALALVTGAGGAHAFSLMRFKHGG